jgi:hypothetical protein
MIVVNVIIVGFFVISLGGIIFHTVKRHKTIEELVDGWEDNEDVDIDQIKKL